MFICIFSSYVESQEYNYYSYGTGYLDSASIRGPLGPEWHPWIDIADPANYAFHDQPWHIGASWNVGDAINVGWAGLNHGQYSNILMRWDLSGGPAGETHALYSEVTSATLKIYVGHFVTDSATGAWGGSIEVRPVLASSGDWVAEETTWNERKEGEFWFAPGGDVAGDVIGSYDDYVAYGFNSPDGSIWNIDYEVVISLQGSPDFGDGSLTDLINSWASSDQSVNSGILLSILNHPDSMDHDIAFGSHNGPDSNMIAPVLTVEGTLIPEPGTLALLGLGALMLMKRRRV